MASEMPSINPATVAEAPSLLTAPAGSVCDSHEEAALLYILRLLNRTVHRNVLTPVERAFVEGARAMFQHLTATCDTLLATASTERELYQTAADDTATSKSVGPVERTSRRDTRKKQAAATTA
jgi:hypothetical protein